MYHMWVDREGAEFIDNKHPNRFTHSLVYTQLYILVQMSVTFIALQKALHAERDIVLPMSVRISVQCLYCV